MTTEITYSVHRQRVALFDRFKTAFNTAADQRALRNEWVQLGDGHELGWVLYERDVMLAEVNQARAELGRPPVSLDVIVRAENHACGHIDYATKWPLYCAEIVLDLPPWA